MKWLKLLALATSLCSAQIVVKYPPSYKDTSGICDSCLMVIWVNDTLATPSVGGHYLKMNGVQLKAFFRHDVIDTGGLTCDSITAGNGLVKSGAITHCTIAADSASGKRMILWYSRNKGGQYITGVDTLHGLIDSGTATFTGTLTGAAGSFTTLTVNSSLTNDNTVLLENTSSTGFGPYIKAGSTSRYALFVQDYTGVNPLLFLGGNAHLGIGISDPTENFGLKALSGNTNQRIWRGSGTDYGLGFTAEDGNGDVDIMSMGDASGVTMHFKMRGIGTPVDAFDIAGSGISTFNFRVNTLNTYYERGLEMATRGYVDSTGGVTKGYVDSGDVATQAAARRFAADSLLVLGIPCTLCLNSENGTVSGLNPGDGGALWQQWAKTHGDTLTTKSYVDSVSAPPPSYCYSDCAEIGEDINLDTVPNIAYIHQLNVNPGGGSMTVAMPGTDNVPDAYPMTVCAIGGGDASVTFTFPGSSLAVGDAKLPNVYLTNTTVCKTFTVHNTVWYQTASSTGKNP